MNSALAHLGRGSNAARQRRLAAAALLALLGALALPTATQAQDRVLVSNFAEADGGGVADVRPPGFTVGGNVFGERRGAQRFTTGPNPAGYTLQSVVLNLRSAIGTAPVVHVAIHENNSSGNPGALLAALDNPADPIGGNRTFSAPTPLPIDANTRYWVVVSSTTTTDSSFGISLTLSNDQTTTHEFSIRDSRLQGTPGSWTEDGRTVVKMEVRGTLAPPTVTSVVVASAPQSGDTYRSYETMRFTVTFSEPVEVKPHGRLRLKVGLDNPGGASGSTVEAVFSGLSQSQRPTADTPQARLAPHMHFEYKVQLFDRDEDGVRIGANALRLASGARIQGEGGGDADLDHAAVGTLSDHKVDGTAKVGGTADVPMIRRIEVVSTPRLRSKGTTNRDTYGEGENIRIAVRFDQPVVVEGAPTFALEVGNPCRAVCEAYYESGSGTNTLVFAYLVLEVDIDRDGIAIRGNPIEVVSGDSIRNAADQEAHLSYRGKGTQRGHKVDGSRAAGSHLSVEDAEAHEADGAMEFTVRLEPHGLGIVTVDYATADGSGDTGAVAGEDYTETSGTLRFNSLETERTVSVPITDDAHEDDGETFTLTLSNPDGAKLRSGEGAATGTIHNSEIQPLTATFEDVPAAHDGSAFTFRMAFSEDIGISYRALREDALAVTGGRVTGGKRVDDRRDLFEMTVEPDGAGDVTIELPAGRECGVSGAICTKGENRRQLTNSPSATVAGPPDEPLTANFEGMPAEHRGEGGFHFRVAFSEDIGISFRSLREDAFTVTGGRVTGGKRVDDRRDLFRMTVRPDADGDVTITLPEGRDCAVSGAICTKGENRRQLTNTPSATVRGPASGMDFAHFAKGATITSEMVFLNPSTQPSRPAIYFYDTKGDPIPAESVVDLTGDLEITEDGALTVRTEMEPLAALTISTHGQGEPVSGSVTVFSDGPIGGVVRYSVPEIGVAGVGPGQPTSDALFPVRRQAGGIRTAAALHNLEAEAMGVNCRLMRGGVALEEVEIHLEANGQASWFIEDTFTATDTSDFLGSVRCTAPGNGRFTAVALEMDAANRIFTTLPVVPVDPPGSGNQQTTLDFAHFVNGTGITSEMVFLNPSTQPSRPAVYFYDTEGNPIPAESVVDVTGDLEITEDGALTVQTKMEPLGELTISTHGRGELVTGSVRVVSDCPLGGMLRFEHPGVGAGVVGASPPLSDALFPVRRQEGGINTWAAIHNLESSPGLVRCDLMREGVLLDVASIPLEANGQTSWFIDQAFPAADTSDFAGSVRCDVVGEGLFSAVALEMDPGTRIFTTLPMVPVREMPD